MCGIAGILSTGSWRGTPDVNWLEDLCSGFGTAEKDPEPWAETSRLLDELADHFDELMSFGLHMEIVSNGRARNQVEDLMGHIEALRGRAAEMMKQGGRSDELERLHESLLDYHWQLDWEVLRNVERSRALIPGNISNGRAQRPVHFLAWATEQVMESLDKLEIRGRDSAGIAIACVLEPNASENELLDEDEKDELERRLSIENADTGQVLLRRLQDGRLICRFIYKVANLVGSLGDNGTTLRSAIREDRLLWKLGASLEKVNIVVHTRWASNGIINVPNCHPVDGEVVCPDADQGSEGSKREDTLFVLNGDVDNYHALVESSVHSRKAMIPRSISTDAKILPVLFGLETSPEGSTKARFRQVMQLCEGSLAVVMQNPEAPDTLFLAQKGSGQSLYLGKTMDGWVVASEAYGLAARCRWSYPLTTTEQGGVSVVIGTNGSSEEGDGFGLSGAYLAGGGAFDLKPEAIEIFSRDVFLEGFEYYIEKEIHEAPESVRRTLQGKYSKGEDWVEFPTTFCGNSEGLLQRLRSRDLEPIRRIVVVGQGTASIAAMGAAFLIRRAIAGSGIAVDSMKASELVGFVTEQTQRDTLLIAVSQSGTTTDTNRVVDLAREKGAWVHSIVNRRNSPLVRKSDSHIYTSNGRDVEMAVASTKAYYSQVTAGKLMALWLARELGRLSDKRILEELQELESLPEKIEEVLAEQDTIARYAWEDAPSSRYWAVVGNGANRIAAEEIRIKLSELCYKSIPCDVTEDKKHIDLSTEPFTIVVANDLPEMVVQDTVKEVVIFKAHNGRPMVLCAQGENRFDSVAERTIKLPRIGGGLAFVLATVAGHIWGVEAAKAIDEQAQALRSVRSMLARAMEHPEELHHYELRKILETAVLIIEEGRADSALPAHLAAAVVRLRYAPWLQAGSESVPAEESELSAGLELINRAVEEMTRTVDTIRHQAKTVTVGISRPQREISPLVLDNMRSLGVKTDNLEPLDQSLLEVLSPVVSGVPGCLLYEVIDRTGFSTGFSDRKIVAVNGTGRCRVEDSRYADPQPAAGTKRKVLRTGLGAWTAGTDGTHNVLIVPVYGEAGGSCSDLLLLHLEIAPQASLQQKIAVLRKLDDKYVDLEEQREELALPMKLDDILNRVSPRDLIFKSVRQILTQCLPARE